ncbi:MAG: hypothetical protein ACMG57_02955 [Candidatus Dojkabacteria bacterium]
MEKLLDRKVQQYIQTANLMLDNYRQLPMSARDSLFDRFLERFIYLVLCRITKDFTEEQADVFIEVLKESFKLDHSQATILFVHNYYNYIMNMNDDSEPQKILKLMYEAKPSGNSFTEIINSMSEDEAKDIIRSYNEIKFDEKVIVQ